MATKAVIRADLKKVMTVLEQQCCAILEWPPERVIWTTPEEIEDQHPQGDGYLCLWFGGGNINDAVFEGAGRVDTRLNGQLEVLIRTRFGADNANEKKAALFDAELGHTVAIIEVFDAMSAFNASDAAGDLDGGIGNWLTIQPVKPQSVSRTRSRPKDRDWLESTAHFLFVLMLDLDQSRQ